MTDDVLVAWAMDGADVAVKGDFAARLGERCDTHEVVFQGWEDVYSSGFGGNAREWEFGCVWM